MDEASTPIELVKRAIEAFNAKDEVTLREICAVDSVYTDVPSNRDFKGHEEVFSYFATLYAAYPDMACRIVDVLPSENKVGVELITSGTHTGTFETPFGTFPPTGKPFTFRGFQVCTIEDGKILTTVAFYDQATVLLQLGLLPEPALATA